MPRWLVWICWSVLFAVLPALLTWVIGYLFQSGVWPPAEDVIGSGQLLLTSIGLVGFGAREVAAYNGDDLPRVRFALIFLSCGGMLLLGGLYGAVIAAGMPDPTDPSQPVLDISRSVVVGISVVAWLVCFGFSGFVSVFAPGEQNRDGRRR